MGGNETDASGASEQHARPTAPAFPNGQADPPPSSRLDPATRNARELEIARLSRLYGVLSQVNQAIVWMPTREQLFRRVCQVLVEQGEFRVASIGWQAPGNGRLEPVASWGADASYLEVFDVHADPHPEDRGPSGTAVRENRPFICNDLLDEPATLPWRLELERRGFRAFAAFPIREKGIVRGTLGVYADEAGFFEGREIALLTEAANDISFALDNLARDIERQEAEKTLRQERDFSDALLNSLPGVFYLYDSTGRFLRWNENFERVTGYTGAEIRSMHPLAFFPEEDRERVAARIAEVFQKGESAVEAGFVSRDGRVTPYHFTGVLSRVDGQSCLVGVGIDITERKRAEAARRASEGRYRTLFEHAPDGILIADADSRYLDANASMCRMLGYTRDELVGLDASDIVVPAEVEHIAPALGVIRSRSEYGREWQFRRQDASVFPAEVIATVMPDGNLMGMVRDVTERKRTEKALRELNETLELKVRERTQELSLALVRAESADRLKSAFLATMSHELRTPLNSILGFTGIVLAGMAGPLNQEQTKQLGMVRGSARHLLELINDVLDLSKIEAEQLEVRCEMLDLAASVERVAASVRQLAEQRGLALRVVLPSELGQLSSDRRRLEQIILNLLNNAIKFTERGDITLTVELRLARLGSPSAAACPAVCLRVTDTGIGIKAEDLATLFQPFRQIDSGLARQHEGTGLGLTICRRLATLLGGELLVRSEWGKGSEFSLTLPLGRLPDT